MHETRDIARRELRDHEELYWSGAPSAWAFAKKTLPSVLFAIPWTVFAVFWTCAAAGFEFPDFSDESEMAYFPLFGLPFVLVGVAMLSSPLWAMRRAAKTVYALTDQRAMIIKVGRVLKVESYPPSAFSLGELVERADGSGNLMFLKSQGALRRQSGDSAPVTTGFRGIQDVRRVQDLIEEVIAKHTKS